MSSEIIFNDIEVKDSIISSGETTTTKDNISPFSFLEFITNTGVDYSPEQYNKFYLFYLKKWADYKNSAASNDAIKFSELYIDFLKELTLTFSTQQEQKFISTLDFNDPVDLDVVMPFFVEKIRQVVLFYKEKRDTAKYTIERNKIKGTSLSIERALYETVYDYVFSSQSNPSYSTIDYSLSSLQANLKIDLQEFVDVYSDYFDLPKGTDPFTTVNREDVDVTLFFDDPSAIFKSEVFLNQIPLAVNTSLSYSEACDPTNPLSLLENQEVDKTGFSYAEKNSLKIKYLEKFMGVDLHYINATTSPPTSGVLFRADTPTNNIQNLQNVYTPTAESNEIKLLRDVGMFFKPDKTGIFQLNSNSFTYSIDPTRIEDGKIYIYPDPNIYGNVSIQKQEVYPLLYTYDNRVDIKNVSSSFSSGDPDVKNTDQTFSPYYSREQTTLRTQAKDSEYSLNFNDLFNEGYITKYQTDIYGNEYALFKDSFGETFKGIEEYETQPILNLLLNGHTFYDRTEGFNFDYTTASRDGNTVRSGLSTLTVNYPFSPSSPLMSPSFILSGSPWFLYFREFLPYQELTYADGFKDSIPYTTNYIGVFRDGGTFTFIDGTKLPDPISSDNPGYPGNNNDLFYYQLLIIGGSQATDAFLSTESLSNILTEDNLELQAEPVQDYDCGYFTDEVQLTNDYNYGSNYSYYDNLLPGSDTIISSITGNDVYKAVSYKKELEGKIFVKNATKLHSQPVSAALNAIFGKYSDTVTNEIYNDPKNIEIFNNSICIETPNFLVIDKIQYENGEFVIPSTKNNVFSITNNDISGFSNRFYNEKDNSIVFCTIEQTQSLSASNRKGVYPKIYRYDLSTNTDRLLFPRTTDITSLSSKFNLSAVFTNNFNINIVNVERPAIS